MHTMSTGGCTVPSSGLVEVMTAGQCHALLGSAHYRLPTEY